MKRSEFHCAGLVCLWCHKKQHCEQENLHVTPALVWSAFSAVCCLLSTWPGGSLVSDATKGGTCPKCHKMTFFWNWEPYALPCFCVICVNLWYSVGELFNCAVMDPLADLVCFGFFCLHVYIRVKIVILRKMEGKLQSKWERSFLYINHSVWKWSLVPEQLWWLCTVCSMHLYPLIQPFGICTLFICSFTILEFKTNWKENQWRKALVKERWRKSFFICRRDECYWK